MFKVIGTWIILAMVLFFGYNGFLAPTFHQVKSFLPALTMWASVGAAGLIIGSMLLLGKKV